MQEGVARQMGVNVTGLFLLAYLCDVLSVPLLNQVYRLQVLGWLTFGDFYYVFSPWVPWRVFSAFFYRY